MVGSVGYGGDLGGVTFQPVGDIADGNAWINSHLPPAQEEPRLIVTQTLDSSTLTIGDGASLTVQGGHGSAPGSITAVQVNDAANGVRLVGTSGGTSSTAVITAPIQQGSVSVTGTLAAATGEGPSQGGGTVQGHIANVGGEVAIVLDGPSTTALTLQGSRTISSEHAGMVQTNQGTTPTVTAGTSGRAQLSTSFEQGSTTSGAVFVQSSDPDGPDNASTSVGGRLAHTGPVHGSASFETGTTGNLGFTTVGVTGGVTLAPVEINGRYQQTVTDGPDNDVSTWGVDAAVQITPGLTGTAGVQHADNGATPDQTTTSGGLTWQINPYNRVSGQVQNVNTSAETGDHTRLTVGGTSQLSPGVAANVEYGTNVDGATNDRLSGGLSVENGNLTYGVLGHYQSTDGPDNDSWGVEGRVRLEF